MKMILNGNYEMEVRSIEKLSNGLDVKMETSSMDLVERTIKAAGDLKDIVFTFGSGDIFARYYNLALIALHKENDVVTARFKNQVVVASTDVAAELSTLKNLIENYQARINSSQELQDEAIGELAELVSNLENEKVIYEENVSGEEME
ncbi:MAG: hypothetical protein HDR11_17840 [Lachnospiraceae bacterium]|nr:hypothetical protein [Lachnospiraceae bacterium]MBD5499579.1 hypothetical protein [Lachnospiraceae bacterium]